MSRKTGWPCACCGRRKGSVHPYAKAGIYAKGTRLCAQCITSARASKLAAFMAYVKG